MYNKFFKRTIDIMLSIFGLPILLLIIIVVGPLIYLTDKGNIFYNADRLGKDGEIFRMYKFRTMKMNAPDLRNADGSTFNSESDPRLTWIGAFIRKTSLDEVPQVINVLKGEMSLIGPRPDLPEHINEYSLIERRKLEVRPGITGLNQAYYRNAIPWKKRIEIDVRYVDNITFLMDMKILFATAISLILRKNIFMERENK